MRFSEIYTRKSPRSCLSPFRDAQRKKLLGAIDDGLWRTGYHDFSYLGHSPDYFAVIAKDDSGTPTALHVRCNSLDYSDLPDIVQRPRATFGIVEGETRLQVEVRAPYHRGWASIDFPIAALLAFSAAGFIWKAPRAEVIRPNREHISKIAIISGDGITRCDSREDILRNFRTFSGNFLSRTHQGETKQGTVYEFGRFLMFVGEYLADEAHLAEDAKEAKVNYLIFSHTLVRGEKTRVGFLFDSNLAVTGAKIRERLDITAERPGSAQRAQPAATPSA